MLYVRVCEGCGRYVPFRYRGGRRVVRGRDEKEGEEE